MLPGAFDSADADVEGLGDLLVGPALGLIGLQEDADASQDAGVGLEVMTPDPSVEVLTDTVQLELALLNLITNSVDAMASGGNLTVCLRCVNDRLRLDIEDTGGGIPPEVVARIFDPWVTTKAQGKGSGLGLSIARQVVASHGGTIRVDNRPGKGAIVTIDLPAAQGLPPQLDVPHAQNSDR